MKKRISILDNYGDNFNKKEYITNPAIGRDEQIKQLTKNANDVLVVEMNLGQMYYEVDRAVNATANTHLLGVIGGLLPTPEEILSKIEEIGGN